MPTATCSRAAARLAVALGLLLAMVASLIGPATPARAAAADLFFSEYVEGSSNNKALEIYNGTGASVDLTAAGYVVQMYFNGAATAPTTVSLSGTVAAGDVFVVAHASANTTILAQADQTSSASWYNGDDAVVLRKGGPAGTTVDLIGQVGFDPGSEWGSGLISTQDNTLRRAASVCAGDTNPSDAFDPATEWAGFAVDTFDGLGSHTASCGGVGEAAPSVIATSPANGASGVAVGSTLSVTFSEPVNAASAFSLTCGGGPLSLTTGGGPTSFTLDPVADLPAGASCTLTVSAASVADQDSDDPPDNPAADFTSSFNTATSGPTVTPIHAIQGSGASVTGAGPFMVEAVVVGDYQASSALGGFFIQEEDSDADSDPATSEGIFVYCASCPVGVAVGDRVRVSGSAAESFGMSQLTAGTADSVTVLSQSMTLPTPAAPVLPVPGVPSGDLAAAEAAIDAYFEPFEGMLVRFAGELTVAEYFELARFGQLVLSAQGRPRQFTDVSAPSAAGYINHQIDVARRTIILDDADDTQNSAIGGSAGTANLPYAYPEGGLSLTSRFRGGDTISGLTGPLQYAFGAWRLRPVPSVYDYTVTPANPRPAAPTLEGSLKVAASNVLNYFLTVDTTSSGSSGSCGASQTLDCRGPDSAAERERQQAKLTQALLGLDADIVGLIELENTPGVDPTQEIVNDLNAVAGVGTYAAINTGVIGTDAIRVGLIYKPVKVTPVGTFAILDSSVDSRYDSSRNRPALAQTFAQQGSGERLTVVVNHLKSKGSGCGAGDDDTTTGQGNCTGTRTQAAQALAAWLAGDPTGSGDPDMLIVGDLNSYRNEDPITALESAGYVDLIDTRLGAAAYSYLFDGQLGYLDHALASPSLAAQVVGVTEWHINADEPPLFDYNDDVRDTGEATFERESNALSLYAADQYRTSDHDPVLVGIEPGASQAPQPRAYLPLVQR